MRRSRVPGTRLDDEGEGGKWKGRKPERMEPESKGLSAPAVAVQENQEPHPIHAPASQCLLSSSPLLGVWDTREWLKSPSPSPLKSTQWLPIGSRPGNIRSRFQFSPRKQTWLCIRTTDRPSHRYLFLSSHHYRSPCLRLQSPGALHLAPPRASPLSLLFPRSRRTGTLLRGSADSKSARG